MPGCWRVAEKQHSWLEASADKEKRRRDGRCRVLTHERRETVVAQRVEEISSELKSIAETTARDGVAWRQFSGGKSRYLSRDHCGEP